MSFNHIYCQKTKTKKASIVFKEERNMDTWKNTIKERGKSNDPGQKLNRSWLNVWKLTVAPRNLFVKPLT